jgi:hypothetical protein
LNEAAGGERQLPTGLSSTGGGRPKAPGSLVRPLTSLGHHPTAAAKLERSPGPLARVRIRRPEFVAPERVACRSASGLTSPSTASSSAKDPKEGSITHATRRDRSLSSCAASWSSIRSHSAPGQNPTAAEAPCLFSIFAHVDSAHLFDRSSPEGRPGRAFDVAPVVCHFSGQSSAGFLALLRPESSLLVALPFPVTACREIGPRNAKIRLRSAPTATATARDRANSLYLPC